MRVFEIWASFVPNFISFTASIAEIAHREKIAYSITHSPSLLMPRELKLAL